MDAQQQNDVLTQVMSLGAVAADFHRSNTDPGEAEAVGDNSPDPPQHYQIWQFAIMVITLICGIVGGVYLFTHNMGADYVTVREYTSQIESIKDLIKITNAQLQDTNTQIRDFRKDFSDEINQRFNVIQNHFDQDDRRLSDIERRVGDRK